jgi:chemotaxis protein histidine kinase CheA
MAFSPSHVLELTRCAFRQEAEELLAELDTALLQLEAAPTNLDSINRAFRAMHTLKGSGATAGFSEISALVHDVEDIFNGARAGRVRITSPIIDLVLKVGDVVRRLLFAPTSQGPQLQDEGMGFVRALKALVPTAGAPAAVQAAVVTATVTPVDLEAHAGLWSIHFAPTARIFHTSSDPVMLLRELLSLGHGVVRASTARLCGEKAIDPTLCYLSWDVQLATSQPREKLKDVFVFVEDVATVRIEPVASGQCWVLRAEAYFDAAIMQEFRDEAAEDIAEIEAHLLALEERAEESDHLDGLRRSLHNLKGLSQLLLSDVKRPPPRRHPLRAMSELCHVAESFLQARGPGGGALDDETADVLLQTVDWLKGLVDACDEGREAWPDELLTLLGAVAHESTASILPSDLLASALRGGQRPMIRAVVAQCDEVLRAIEAGREPEAAPSSDAWTTLGRVLGTLEKTAAFEGATGVSSRLQALVSTCHSAPQAPPEWESFRARYRSVVSGFETAPAIVVPSIRPRGRTISIRPSRLPAVASLGPKAADAKAAPTAARSIRVDQDKLDVLMGAIGELLVAKNALPVLVARVRSSDNQVGKEIKATVDAIAHIADDLQNAMRQIRMMPIRSVFQRFPRMIRDLSRSENKSVQLIISGDETELDKTVLEQIADPLVHLVRNALDHGIELPADRLAQGKPEMGTIGLEVLKEGSNVVIRISDDGRGMSPQRLRAKAVEKGLLSEADAASMPDRRALDLIFLPGFSTAETVTDLSGRGVGMDVVQSNIRALHGTIAITSEMGRGSSMSITLPSSLMISKGVLVECASEQYVLPIESIREMVKLQGEQIRRFRGVAMTNIRGAICPVFSLGRLLGIEAAGGDEFVMTDGVARAAIVATQGGDIAVVVDRLVAEIDVIVKPLSRGLDKLVLFQGATILGDGSVALILDVRKLDTLAGLDAGRAHGDGTVDAAA